MNKEQKMYKEFCEKYFKVGDILDSTADVLAKFTVEKALTVKDMLFIPAIIMAILKDVEEKQEKEKE